MLSWVDRYIDAKSMAPRLANNFRHANYRSRRCVLYHNITTKYSGKGKCPRQAKASFCLFLCCNGILVFLPNTDIFIIRCHSDDKL
jgi:hypothetical protein